MTYSLRFVVPLVLAFMALPPIWWVFETTEQRSTRQVEEHADKELKSLMTQIQGNLENVLRRGDGDRIPEGFMSLGGNPNIKVAYLIGAEDCIFASTERALIGKTAYPSINADLGADIAETANDLEVTLDGVRAGNGGVVLRHADGDSLIGMHPIRFGRESTSIVSTGVLLIVYNLHERRAAAHAVVRLQAAKISAVYIGLMLFLGIFLHLLVTRRIARLSEAATRIAAGDSSVSLPTHGRDEISRLGQTLNDMFAQREKSEKTIRENERYLQSILDNTPSLIYVKDLDGRYLLANKMFDSLPKTTSLGAVGYTDFDIFPEHEAKELCAHDQAVLRSRGHMEFREDLQFGDVSHTFLSVKFCLLDEQGEPYALCGISTNITATARMEERD